MRPSRDADSRGLVERARFVAFEFLTRLDDDGTRWHHTRAVAARAARAAPTLTDRQAQTLCAAAWLHDIGYAPSLATHHFHPVDGAEYIAHVFPTEDLAGLVAHHSGSRFVAEARGLEHLLAPWTDPDLWSGPVPDALTWADQTTGPDGEPTTLDARLHEMLTRHGPHSPNARCHPRRAPALAAAVHATERRLSNTA